MTELKPDALPDALPDAVAHEDPVPEPPRRGRNDEDAISQLVRVLARLPGLGRRSATRAALRLLSERSDFLEPLAEALSRAVEEVCICQECGNLDTRDPCQICQDPKRDDGLLCVVEEVGDLWALERSGVFRGRYHVLGGTLSAAERRGPEDITADRLRGRAQNNDVREVILALSATVEGQTTAHFVAEGLASTGCQLSVLGQGLPVGGAVNYLDDGTLFAAFRSRSALRAD